MGVWLILISELIWQLNALFQAKYTLCSSFHSTTVYIFSSWIKDSQQYKLQRVPSGHLLNYAACVPELVTRTDALQHLRVSAVKHWWYYSYYSFTDGFIVSRIFFYHLKLGDCTIFYSHISTSVFAANVSFVRLLHLCCTFKLIT